MEPIRVLQVVTTMERAGLETMLMNYYRHMDTDRVQFDFLKHREGHHAYDDEIRALGGKIYSVPPFNPLNTNGYLDALDAFFGEHPEYRIVHSHLDCLSSVPLRYAKKHGVPVRIAHSHVSRMTWDIKYPVRACCRARIPHMATELFACSEEAGRWMYGRHPFRVISNAIDCGLFAYDADTAACLRRENGLKGRFTVAHVGRFDPVKNHGFLLDVFREIVCRNRESVLLLAGVGPAMDDIREKVRACGLEEQVRFLGSVSNVAQVLAMADVFVFPSLYEGLGISLVEAQASGLPCFASADCVPDDANVTGQVTYLPLDAGAKIWAEQILSVRNRSSDRCGKVELLAEKGYDIAAEAKKLQDYYLRKFVEEA